MNMVDPNKLSGSSPDEGKGTEVDGASVENENIEVICLFCKREVKNKCTVSNNEHLLNAMASLSIEYYALPTVTDYGCFDCIKTILVLAEQRRIFQRNILKNRANYYVRCGDKKMCAKYLAETKSSKSNFFPTAPGPSNLKITDVRTITRAETETINRIPNHVDEFKNVSNEDNSDNSANKLLDVMYEQPESVLATESGGNVHDSGRSVSSTTNTSLYKCQYCKRTYAKQGFLRKHEKRHSKNIPKSRKSLFKCSHCNSVLDTLALLRKHERTHRERMKCSYCEEEFSIRNKLEFHEAICLGKKAAAEENGIRQYFTRSQKTMPSDSESDSDTEFDWEPPPYDDRVKRWISEVDNDALSRYSAPSTLPRRSIFLTVPTRFTSASDITDLETEADSTTSSLFGQRVQIRAKDSVHSIRRAKKRKFVNLTNKQWICPEESCGYMDASLDSLMNHDIECHEPMALFFCTKCRGRFVRRFYLEQHLRFQSFGLWVCCLCESQFDNEPDLKYHFEEHNENDRHDCEICRYTFVTDHELQKHLCTKEHLNRKKMRRCIFLERRTYSHVAEEPEGPKPYRSVIKILKLMDQERDDQFRLLSWRSSWRQGIVFHIGSDNKSHNCAGLRLQQS